jgi:hypothetical protein
MKRSRFIEVQINGILKDHEAGAPVRAVFCFGAYEAGVDPNQ